MNKFSELIAAGVAEFNYTPIAQSTPNQCPICRAYNNVYSLANDTHMSMLEDGRYVITGHAIRNKREFDNFLCSRYWGAMNFIDSGMNAPSEFFRKNFLFGHYDVLNGDDVYILDQLSQEEWEMQTSSVTTCPDQTECVGSSIPESLRSITTDGNASHIYECFKQSNIEKSLNENLYVCGTNWLMVNLSTGKKFVSIGQKKSYIL